ncbi:MAG: hypothetical protein JWO06_2691 [Bacteroidota bacterium]|nr:hypothetical protein [Bacteroidota bacterium]
MGKTINQQPPFTGDPLQNTYFVLDQLSNHEYKTFKISGSQLAQMAGALSFPTDTLTDSDIGKLVMNKNGKAVVANRDTPRPAQAGQWTLTVNAVFEKPTPSQVDFTFTGLPNEGDYLVLGLQRFVFKTSPTNPYDIQIGADIPVTIANTSSLLNYTYADQWTASNDGVNTVSVVFDAKNNTGFSNPLSDISFGLYYNVANPDQVDSISENIQLQIAEPGNLQHIREFNRAVFIYGGEQLSYFDVSSQSTSIGELLFGLKWTDTVNDQASNLVSGINAKFAGKLHASTINNIVTIDAITQPDNGSESDIALSGNANQYITLTTDKFNIAANPDWITDPVLGILSGLLDSTAIINTSGILSAFLSGNTAIDISDIGNDLSKANLFNRVLLPSDNGTLESALGLLEGGNLNFDTWLILHFYNDNIFYAMSSASPGNPILVKRGIPFSLLLLLAGAS